MREGSLANLHLPNGPLRVPRWLIIDDGELVTNTRVSWQMPYSRAISQKVFSPKNIVNDTRMSVYFNIKPFSGYLTILHNV